MSKTPHNNTKKRKRATDSQEYLCTKSWRMVPYTDSFIESVGRELCEWVLEEIEEDELKGRRLTLNQFWRKRGIDHKSAEFWVGTRPIFARMVAFAREAIADKREIGAILKKFDSSTVAFIQPEYSEAWKQMTEWRNDLKTKVAQASVQPIPYEANPVPKTSLFEEHLERAKKEDNKAE